MSAATAAAGRIAWGVGERAEGSPWLTCIGSAIGEGVYTTEAEALEYAEALRARNLAWLADVEVHRVKVVPHSGVQHGYAYRIV